MKKLLLLVGAIAFTTAGSVLAQPRASGEKIDFRAVNPVMQALADAVVVADDLVDFAYPRFDEAASNLQQEKLKYDLQGSMKDTPWLDGGRAEIVGTSSYVTDRNPARTGIVVTMASTIRTDILALIRYTAYLAIKKSTHHNPKFDARIDAHLRRLAVAQSLDEVNTLLLSARTLAKDMVQYQIDKEVDYLQCLQSGSCQMSSPSEQQAAIERQIRYIAQWKKSLQAYDDVKFTTKVEGGKIHELTLESPNMSLFFDHYYDYHPKPATARTTFTDQSISARLEGFVDIKAKNLDELKSDITQRLNGLQEGNMHAKDLTQENFRQALIAFKRFIRGENHY